MIKSKIRSCSVCKSNPVCITRRAFIEKVYPNFYVTKSAVFKECMEFLAKYCRLYQYKEPVDGFEVVEDLEKRGF